MCKTEHVDISCFGLFMLVFVLFSWQTYALNYLFCLLLKDITCFCMTLAYKLHVLQQPLQLAVHGGCCLPEQTEKHIAEGEFCTVAWQECTVIGTYNVVLLTPYTLTYG